MSEQHDGCVSSANTNAPTPVAAQTSAQAIGVTEMPMQAMQAGGAPVQAAPQETETPVANLGTLECPPLHGR